MDNTTTINPAGNAYNLPQLDVQILAAMDAWEENAALNHKITSWWQKRKAFLSQAVMFLISYIDKFVQVVDNLLENGPDKKATVLAAISTLYDYIIKESMPIFLKPFNPIIKRFVIYIVISGSIDFIVDKYRNGLWSKENTDGEKTEEKL